MQIYGSRYTPGIRGDNVHFKIGEVVKYQLSNGKVIDIKIDSERMMHDHSPVMGYEAIFLDDKKRYFASGDRIISWEGKC